MTFVKRKRAAFILLLIGACAALFSGCGIGSEASEEETLIKAAKNELASLKSGCITVTNNDTGETEQTFTFRYDEVGVLSWCLTGVTDGKPYYNYSNGYETYTIENGEYSFCKKGEQQFQMFTSDVRHPMTGEDYIFYEKAAVKNITSEKTDDGTTYVCEYEPKAISVDGALGELTEFSVTYAFDNEDKLRYFEQESVYEKDGAENKYSYRIEITQKNSVSRIEMPEEVKAAKEGNL